MVLMTTIGPEPAAGAAARPRRVSHLQVTSGITFGILIVLVLAHFVNECRSLGFDSWCTYDLRDSRKATKS